MIQGKKVLRAALLSLLMLTLLSCNKGDTTTAPYGSEIIVQPEKLTVGDGSGVATIHDTYFTITVLDEFGRPKSGVELFIDYLWATPDVYGVVQLYDDGVAVEAPMKVFTDKSGTYHLRVDFISGALEYKAYIQVVSASAVIGMAEIDIKM